MNSYTPAVVTSFSQCTLSLRNRTKRSGVAVCAHDGFAARIPTKWILQLALACLCVAPAATADHSGTLIWNNRDQLEGNLRGFADGKLIWGSDLFDKPLRIDADVISHVMLQTEKTEAENSATFRLETQFGDVLFGDLRSVSDTEVELSSTRFGVISIKRQAVRELRQLSHNKVVYDGPRWLDDWRVLKVGRELSEWQTTDMGFLRTSKYGGEIFHDLPSLDQAEINLAISWKDKPGFQIDFSSPADLMGVRSKPKLSIKSWGTDIVAQSSFGTTSFVPLTKLTKNQTEFRLRIIWNNENGIARLLTAEGRELADVPVNKVANQFGVLFKNRSDDLTVEQIRLSKWNGKKQSGERKPGKAYIRLADGRLLDDSVKSLKLGARSIVTEAGESVKLSQLAIAELTPSAENEFESSRLRFADGTVISGDLVSMDETQLELNSSVLLQPIRGSHAGLTGIRFYNERTHEFDFELLSDGRRLSGNLKSVADSGRLGWASVGSEEAAAFDKNIRYTIERRLSEQVKQASLSAGEIIYLQDGTVLLGEVRRMDSESLVVQTAYAGEVTLPFAKLRAVEMVRGSGRASFTDKSWKFLQDTRADLRSPDHLAVSKTVSMQNQELHHGGKLTFTCQWEEGFVGLLTIQLGESGKHVTRCSFTRDRVSARCLVNAASSVTLPSIPDRRANISIETDGQRIAIWVNGILASSADTGRNIPDAGIWIQCGSARNSQLPHRKGNTAPRLTLSRLRVGDHASRLGAGFAAADELSMLLKLPRNKQRNAPQHVLCATNRDLLRGKLVGITSESVQFASGYEEVELPRTKVAAIVWLARADVATPESPPRDGLATELWLRDGSVFIVSDLRMTDTHLQGAHPDLRNLTVPLDQLWKIERTDFAETQSSVSVANWTLEPTKEPQLTSGTDQGTESPLVGQDVADLRLTMLEADEVALADNQDRVVVLDFWASWCAPCVKSLPKLAAIANTFPKDKVRFIAVNQGEAPFTVQTFLAHQDLDIEVSMDADGALAKRFAVKSIPQTVVIGPKGKIQRVFLGTPASLYSGLTDAIEQLIQPTD